MTLPAHVYAVKDRHGKTRFRFRKRGLPSRYLQGTPGSDEFMQSHAACFDPSYQPRPLKRKLRKIQPGDFIGRSCVYFIGASNGPVKIGTTVNLPARLKKLQTGSPMRLKVLACVDGGVELEARYHRLFAGLRVNGEWFSGAAIRAEIRRLNRPTVVQPPVVQPSSAEKISGVFK